MDGIVDNPYVYTLVKLVARRYRVKYVPCSMQHVEITSGADSAEPTPFEIATTTGGKKKPRDNRHLDREDGRSE